MEIICFQNKKGKKIKKKKNEKIAGESAPVFTFSRNRHKKLIEQKANCDVLCLFFFLNRHEHAFYASEYWKICEINDYFDTAVRSWKTQKVHGKSWNFKSFKEYKRCLMLSLAFHSLLGSHYDPKNGCLIE